MTIRDVPPDRGTPRRDPALGVEVLHDPALNKGTAFTEEERDRLRLRGLLPPRVLTLDQQLQKILESFRGKPTDLERYVYLISLQDRNERLFYRFVIEHLAETLPIIYTPTVGQACQRYAHLWRRPRGLFVSAEDRGRIAQVLRNWPADDVRIIVVTDGERILGLGDLGANGMGIPVGKLSLYTACAGVNPAWCLPVTLDVGTENMSYRDDPLYIGLSQARVRGEAYDALVEEFMAGVQAVFPRALVQFEDFATANAFRILRQYHDRACCFNDDIQGTAAVTLAGLWSALRMTARPLLGSGNILFLGAGEAGTGIADLMVTAMKMEGMPEADARTRCWFVDSTGLVVKSREGLAEHKLPYAHDHPPLPDLLSAVTALRPYALIGASGQPQTFTPGVIEAMSAINERPIVFALSNPTSRSECTAEQAYAWSGGRAVFASGSPFPAVDYQGQPFAPGQANNAYIFPGVGLGVIASGARRVTGEMFLSAARTLADIVSEADLATGSAFPPIETIRSISASIATAVAGVAYERGLASEPMPADLRGHIESLMYDASY
jgi:malate dehydrogenase (oxaloacetate-decarboxylating)(NADP+)